MKKKLEVKPREFNVIIEKDEDGYFIASVPDLQGCHTQAKSFGVLMKRIREAISLCVEMEDSTFKPCEFIGFHRISV